MPRICIQASHSNITKNCNLTLRSGTGAPGEIAFTTKTADKLGNILAAKGFTVTEVDANANCDVSILNQDFDLFLALHYEANVHGQGGGFMTAPDPKVDANNAESIRICNAIKAEYFKNTGIVEHEEWITRDMTEYYMWNVLTAKTPCVIIECGVGLDPHDMVILNDTTRVVNAIARGICDAFHVSFDPAPTDYLSTILAVKAEANSKDWLWTKVDKIKKLTAKF